MEIDWNYYRSVAFIEIAIGSTNLTVISALESLKVAVNIAHPELLHNEMAAYKYNSIRLPWRVKAIRRKLHDLIDTTIETAHPDALAALDNFYDVASGIRTKD